MLVANTDVQIFKEYFYQGSNTINVQFDSMDAWSTFGVNGIDVYLFCEGYIGEFMSLS